MTGPSPSHDAAQPIGSTPTRRPTTTAVPAVTVVTVLHRPGAALDGFVRELVAARDELHGATGPDARHCGSAVATLDLLALDRSERGDAGRQLDDLATRHDLTCEVVPVSATPIAPRADDRSRPEPWGALWDGVTRAAARRPAPDLPTPDLPTPDLSTPDLPTRDLPTPDLPTPDLVVTIDAAGHHDARQIPELVRRALDSGDGITLASRWARGGSAPTTGLPRRLASRSAARIAGAWSGLPRTHDITSSFRVVRTDVVGALGDEHTTSGVYGSYAEFVAVSRALGFGVGEVPIEFRPRHSSVPPLAIGDLTGFAADLVRIRRRVRRVRARMRADQTEWSTRDVGTRHQDPALADDFGAATELAVLSEARNFVGWIVDQFDEVLGDDVLEVGAGLGAVSSAIAARRPSARITALEPAPNLLGTLRRSVADTPTITVHPLTSQQWVRGRADPGHDTPGHDTPGLDTPGHDTVVYVNVLEHIRDDVAELATARQLLRPGGHLCVFVPALPRLYGGVDRRSGHYRRYTARRLAHAATEAGFETVRLHHLDALGVVPYWLLYRVLGVSGVGTTTSGLYDRVLVPIGRAVERRPPPFGKNLVLVARVPQPDLTRPDAT